MSPATARGCYLAVDTATEACSAALWLNGEIQERFEVVQREHTQKLLPMIQALMAGGAISGMILAERYLSPRKGSARAMSRLQIDPAGVLSVAAGAAGNHSLLRWTF